MNSKARFWQLANILARTSGLLFTAAGSYFALQGIYFLIQPEVSGVQDMLGFPPSFRPFVIAAVFLVIGVHFLRGEAHRPDLVKGRQTDRSTTERTHNWWTGEPLDN